MARPKKTHEPENINEKVELTNDVVTEMQKKISLLEQERDQLNRKLEKKHQTPSDMKMAQHQMDFRGINEMRQEDSRMVKGVFKCFNPPGGNVEFYFRKWKGDPIEKYTLFDGQEYEIPMAVVRHLNENCYEETKSFLLDANGNQIKGAGKKNFRFSFTPSEYGSPMRHDVQPALHSA